MKHTKPKHVEKQVWGKWFAWHPIKLINESWAWRIDVERRVTFWEIYTFPFGFKWNYMWDYRLPQTNRNWEMDGTGCAQHVPSETIGD